VADDLDADEGSDSQGARIVVLVMGAIFAAFAATARYMTFEGEGARYAAIVIFWVLACCAALCIFVGLFLPAYSRRVYNYFFSLLF
jgi:hypothetical protein